MCKVNTPLPRQKNEIKDYQTNTYIIPKFNADGQNWFKEEKGVKQGETMLNAHCYHNYLEHGKCPALKKG